MRSNIALLTLTRIVYIYIPNWVGRKIVDSSKRPERGIACMLCQYELLDMKLVVEKIKSLSNSVFAETISNVKSSI